MPCAGGAADQLRGAAGPVAGRRRHDGGLPAPAATSWRPQAHRYWFIFPQPIGFLVFFTAALAEINRAPFDMPEAESELVAGYNTEYSGMRWAIFFLAEYANLVAFARAGLHLLLRRPSGPGFPPFVWFLIKVYFFIFVAMWIRWTLPRIRIDQLMDIGWKGLFPSP